MADETPAEQLAKQVAERYFQLSKGDQLYFLSHVGAFLNLVSALNLVTLRESSESLSRSSERLLSLTRWLTGLTAALVAETIAVAALIILYHG